MYRATATPASQQSVEGINKQKKKVWRKNRKLNQLHSRHLFFHHRRNGQGSHCLLQASCRPHFSQDQYCLQQNNGMDALHPILFPLQISEYELVAPHLTGYQMPVLNLMWPKATYPTEPYNLTPLSSFILHTSILFSSLSYSMGMHKNVCNVNTGPQ